MKTLMQILAASVVLVLAAMFAPAAAAAPNGSTSTLGGQAELQRRVDDLLRRVPGGTQVSRNEVSWHGGGVTATLPEPGAQRAGSFCGARSVCLYANTNQRGTKVTYGCGTWNVTNWFPPRTLAGVSSWHRTASRAILTNDGLQGQPLDARLGNVWGWFNDQATTVQVC